MNQIKFALGITTALFLLLGGSAMAATGEESQLKKQSDEINATASTTEGQKTVVQKITTNFSVTEKQVQALRDKKLGYGEMTIALSLSQSLPGGITDENIAKIVSLRQGPPVMGWGKVAKELDLKLGKAIDQTKNVNREARQENHQENHGNSDMHKDQRGNSANHGSMERGQGQGRGMSKGR